MRRFESFLVQSGFFLIPTNLAWHWYTGQAYVSGHLLDYLLPRLYLSDLPILLLLLSWFSQVNLKALLPVRSRLLLPLVLFLLLFFRSLLSPQAFPSLWFLGKLVEMVGFGAYLVTHYHRPAWLRLAFWPLCFSMLLQSFTAFYQYINQKQFIGYLFFGEPTLTQPTGLATSMLPGIVKILPYGTTPHPNVLAGCAVITLLILWQAYEYIPKQLIHLYPLIFTTGLCIMLLIGTESLGAWLGLLSGMLCLTYYRYRISRYLMLVICMIILGSNLLLMVPNKITGYHSLFGFDLSFLTIRYRLNQDAFALIFHSPFFGVGLNRFTPSLIEYNVMDTAPFIQPVHQIFLLWLTETGFVGTLLILIINVNFLKHRHLGRPLAAAAPLVALGVIGLFDHYPLTLQPGQLLLTFSISLLLLRAGSFRSPFASNQPSSLLRE